MPWIISALGIYSAKMGFPQIQWGLNVYMLIGFLQTSFGLNMPMQGIVLVFNLMSVSYHVLSQDMLLTS